MSPAPHRSRSRACRRVGAGFALALALAGAGCGASPYTRHDFVARADAICASTLRTIRAGASASGLAAYAGAVAPVLGSELRQLRALPQPAGAGADRATLRAYLAGLAADAAAYDRLARAATRRDQAGVAAAEGALRASPTVALAARYGLAQCGAPTGTGV